MPNSPETKPARPLTLLSVVIPARDGIRGSDFHDFLHTRTEVTMLLSPKASECGRFP